MCRLLCALHREVQKDYKNCKKRNSLNLTYIIVEKAFKDTRFVKSSTLKLYIPRLNIQLVYQKKNANYDSGVVDMK